MFRHNFQDLSQWNRYGPGPGHDGQGRRDPSQISTSNGILTITGSSNGTTGGMALQNHDQMYGKWTWRVKCPAGASTYHPVCLLWGIGSGSGVNAATGEIDVLEVWQDGLRRHNEFTLHYGDGSQMIGGGVDVDMTVWHTYTVLWTPDKISTWIDDNPPYYSTTDKAKFPQNKMAMTIQLDWFPNEGGSTGGATMQVDYVEIYSLAEATTTPTPTPTPTPTGTATYIFTFGSNHRLWAGSTTGNTGPGAGLPLVGRYVELVGTQADTKATMNKIFGTGAWLAQYVAPYGGTAGKTKLDITSAL